MVLLGAVSVMGVELYRGQRDNEAATALVIPKASAVLLLRLEVVFADEGDLIEKHWPSRLRHVDGQSSSRYSEL